MGRTSTTGKTVQGARGRYRLPPDTTDTVELRTAQGETVTYRLTRDRGGDVVAATGSDGSHHRRRADSPWRDPEKYFSAVEARRERGSGGTPFPGETYGVEY